MNVQNGSSAAGSNLSGTVNLAGHSADLLLSTLAIGGRSGATTVNGTGSFSFDTGTLDATTVTVASRSGTSETTGTVTGTLNLMQTGATTGAVTIGTLNLGINSATTATSSGAVVATLTSVAVERWASRPSTWAMIRLRPVQQRRWAARCKSRRHLRQHHDGHQCDLDERQQFLGDRNLEGVSRHVEHQRNCGCDCDRWHRHGQRLQLECSGDEHDQHHRVAL